MVAPPKRKDLMTQLAALAMEQSLPLDITEGGSHTKVRIGDRVQRERAQAELIRAHGPWKGIDDLEIDIAQRAH